MLIETLANHASARRIDIALQGNDIALSYADLSQTVAEIAQQLKQENPRLIALGMDNHPAWIIIDLAAVASHIPLVPLPHFFSDSQLLHTMLDAGATTLLTDQPERFSQILADFITRKSTLTVAGKRLMQYDLQIPTKKLPPETAKITYTSGTTGAPKGVCLSTKAMLNVAQSVALQTNIHAGYRHVCILPLSTLLENVAGVYASLLAGATVHILPSEQTGLSGSSLNIKQLHSALAQTQANTAIFIPELLNALVSTLEAGATKLNDLKFLAVGGAHVSKNLLQRAKNVNLPLFEGYGLSESASVVALNTEKYNKIGSVGKPLPHVAIQFSEDNEILVKGSNLLGYTGENYGESHDKNSTEITDGYIKTGDIGYMDDDGFLFINGRKKNIFITSYGRNVSPEWVESTLLNSPEILQVCLFGEAKPWNIALIVAKPETSYLLVSSAIEETNKQLPDYARISKWLLADAPFSIKNNQLTPNGRLKRDAISAAYQEKMNDLYKEFA
jgi:long-subunit acyl-CoA synthetase (AMP-forming)